MYNVDHTKSPFLDISLPPAIVVPSGLLVLLYTGVLSIDFYLVRHERHFNKIISPTQLRIAMAVVHSIIPLIFISRHPFTNIIFAGAPWLFATYTAAIPSQDLTLKKWMDTLKAACFDQESTETDSRKIRYKGISKFSLGIIKFVIMKIIINPLLPVRPEQVLEYSWFHPMSVWYTFLFGVKAYCLLGVNDIIMGAEQALFAWNLIDLFNSPIISSSPRDFWSRRWNRVVRNLLHTQIFSTKKSVSENKSIKEPKKAEIPRRVTRSLAASKAVTEAKNDTHDVTVTHVQPKRSSFWTSPSGRGLLAFIVSGAFHELIIMSVCRKMTLENFIFFTFQGLVVMIEVQLRQGAWKQEPTGVNRIWCILTQLLFMSLTGRLFLAPFLRCDKFKESIANF